MNGRLKSGAGEWVRVASVSDVTEGEPLGVVVMSFNLALYNVGRKNLLYRQFSATTPLRYWLRIGWGLSHRMPGARGTVRYPQRQGSPIEQDLKTSR
jgi:hypothetical protein